MTNGAERNKRRIESFEWNTACEFNAEERINLRKFRGPHSLEEKN